MVSDIYGNSTCCSRDVSGVWMAATLTVVYAQIDDCIISGSQMSGGPVRFYVWTRSGDCTFSYLLSQSDGRTNLMPCARWLITRSYPDAGNGQWEMRDLLTGELEFKCSQMPQDYSGWVARSPWAEFFPLLTSRLAISSDGKLVAFGLSLSILIWDVHENIQLVELVGHSAQLSSLAFAKSHDESKYSLVSTSLDGTIRLWDLDQLFKPKEDQHPMTSWAVCPRVEVYNRWEGGCWIKDGNGECLFWLPASCPIRHPLNTLVIGQCAELDMTDFVHGEEWTKCRGSNVDDEPSEVGR
jgi:WD40 repeat protein